LKAVRCTDLVRPDLAAGKQWPKASGKLWLREKHGWKKG